jgi:parvulin-like peptidyl-prolyl isomerase
MISVIRKKVIETNFYKIIFWIVILAMLGIWTLPSKVDKRSGSPDAIWGTINGRTIYETDFARKTLDFEQRLQMMRAEYGQYADQFMAMMGIVQNPQALASESLVRETLLDGVGKDLGLQIHPEYVKQAISNISSVYQELSDLIPVSAIDVRSGSINIEPLRLYLRNFKLSMSDFDAKLEAGLKRKITGNLLANATYAPRFELENEFATRYLPKTFSIMTISKSEIYAEVKKDEITDKDVEAFFNRKNQAGKTYWVPEKRSVQIWKITPQSYGVTIPEQEIERYYQDNKERNYLAELPRVQVRSILLKATTSADLTAAREKAAALRQQLIAHPADFAAKAKELSADSETASNGGLMKPFTKGDEKIERGLERAAFMLKNKDDISEPVQVKDGIALVQLVEKKPRVFKSLSEARKDIVDTLTMQKFSKRFVQDMKEIYRDKNADKLKEIVASKGATPAAKELITNDGSILARTAFALPVRDYAFYVDNKEGYVVHVTAIQEANLPALDAIRTTVKNDLIDERVASLLRYRVSQARQESRQKSLAELSRTYNATVKKVGPVDFDNAEQVKSLRTSGLPVERMLQIEKVGMTEAALDDANGYIIRLDETAPLKEDAFEAKRQVLTEKVGRARTMFITQGFVASLHRNATINLNS